jgi:hypothetical protein
MDAREIFPESAVFQDNTGSLCAFADMFRYELLYRKGGWWVDMDMICMQSFDFEDEYVFSSEHTQTFGMKINNGIFKTPAGSDILLFCKSKAEEIVKKNHSTIKWAELGAEFFHQYIMEHQEFVSFVCRPQVFCPIPYFYYPLLFNNVRIDFTEETYGVHLWNEMLRRNSVDPDMTFHPDSFYERMKRNTL